MPDTTTLPPDEPIDLTNCDREPIHLLGNVQSFGALVAISADWIVQHVSENVTEVLGLAPETLIGDRLDHHLPEATTERLRDRLGATSSEDSVARLFGFEIFEDGRRFDVSAHQSGRSFIFEFEPKIGQSDREDLVLVQPMLRHLAQQKGVPSSSQYPAEELRNLTGFDRVMVYRFGPEGDGTVIAEAKDSDDAETYMGMHFPASDIPRQARALYKRSLLRLIADVDDTVSPIQPQRSPEGQALDLSLAVTRAVSPIHLEYLRNMKVRASMSVSIVIRGELWGLFACHNRAPLYIDYERRTAVELFAQFFAYELERQEGRTSTEATTRAQVMHDRLMMRVTSGGSLMDSVDTIADEIGKAIAYDGIAIYSDGEYVTRGRAPAAEQFHAIARFLNTAAASRVYATDNLVARLPSMEPYVQLCAGILAIPISRTPRDYIVLFRTEVARQVNWAGNPEKPVEVGPMGARLTPRKSFELWKQDVRNRSMPWTAVSVRAAEALRVTLLEVVLKLTEQVNLERKHAQDQQELLIAELNHRVRNVLSLIRSLVNQSRNSARSIEEFTASVDGRVHALAQAHDQLTRKQWTPVPLAELLTTELSAYTGGDDRRFTMTGPGVLLSPEAFSTMALVFHELVTNSVKYGALSQPTGRVTLDVGRESDGRTVMRWTERGGPAVTPPSRRGFGTTIIEKSVPFELNGTAELTFRLTGVEAVFGLPESLVAPAPDDEPEALRHAAAPEREEVALTGTALVVEDNMIIALDAVDILGDFGARNVHVAASVPEGLRICEANAISFALLDVNLGSETSMAVAQALHAQGVPFVLATGYSGHAEALSRFPSAPVVAKPYTAETLAQAMRRLDLTRG